MPLTSISARSLAFLSVNVVNGTIDLDANVELDLTSLDANDNKKITLGEIADNFGDIDVVTGGTLVGTLPIAVSLAGLTLPADPIVTFGATDIFDLDTFFVNFTGLGIDALNFGNMDAAGIVTLIARLSDQLDSLRKSGVFDRVDIPLVDGAIDSVLGFAEVVTSALLYDQGADKEKDGPDRLATDLNAAFAAAGLDSAIAVQGLGGTQIRLDVIDASISGILVEAGSGGAAGFAQLGFLAAAASTAALSHTANVPDNGQLALDATLKITIQRTGQDDEFVEVALERRRDYTQRERWRR